MSDLIDRQAFIENERKLYCEDCDRRKGMKKGKLTFCYEIGETPCRSCWCDDVLTDLEDFPASPRWVRCDSGELPEIGQLVLLYYGGCFSIAARTEDEMYQGKRYWKLYDGYWERIEDDYYWMPIEPPKEDA